MRKPLAQGEEGFPFAGGSSHGHWEAKQNHSNYAQEAEKGNTRRSQGKIGNIRT